MTIPSGFQTVLHYPIRLKNEQRASLWIHMKKETSSWVKENPRNYL